MKKLLGCFLCVMFLACFAGPAAADMIVDDNPPFYNPPFYNPAFLTPNSPTVEEAWLEGLLGFDVDYIDRDEISPYDDGEPSGGWTYAVLKYGQGAVPLDHYAIMDDGDNILELAGLGLPTTAISHVIYFGPQGVPEPAIMLLLGSGILGLALFGRQRFKK
ncbi:MAG: PEP-CTERM sorting domain-containing protein [Desulfobacterales bacterium]|nr:PEP-CTERM sorting domain-containing protein [Desulfobacterales bacterium]